MPFPPVGNAVVGPGSDRNARIDDGDGYASLLLDFRSDSPSVPPHRAHLCDRQPKTDRPWPYVRLNGRLMIDAKKTTHGSRILFSPAPC